MRDDIQIIKPFLLLSLLILNGCAAIIKTAVPMSNITAPTGTYPVGTKTFHLVDSTRSAWYQDKNENARELMVRVWYPAKKNSVNHRAPYVKDYALVRDVITKNFDMPEYLMDNLGTIECNAWLDAEPVAGRATFPIIIFSHGHRGMKIQNTTQVEELASHGYIVIACDHTYDSGVTVLPGNRVIFSRSGLPDGINEDEGRKIREMQIDIRSADITFIIDKVSLDFFGDPGLAKISDLNNIGIFGHSFGGGTSIFTTYNDNRIDAVFGLDSWFMPIPSRLVNQDLKKPFGHLGQVNWGESNNYSILDTLASNNSDLSVHFSVEGSTHFDFTDFSQFSRITKWYGSGEISSARIRMIMNRLLLDFFDHCLKNGKNFDPKSYKEHFPELTTHIY